MTEKTTLTTVAYSKSMSGRLNSISKNLNLSKAQFIDAAILQYYRTGEDPRTPIKESLPKRLQALENKLIGFIRTQDSKYLEKIISNLEVASNQNNKTLDVVNATKTTSEWIKKIVNTIGLESRENSENNLATQKTIVSNQAKIFAEIELTKNKKAKAIAELEAISSLGKVSKSKAIAIINNM